MQSVFSNTIDVKPSARAIKTEKWVVYKKGDVRIEIHRTPNHAHSFWGSSITTLFHYCSIKIIIEPATPIEGSKRKTITVYQDIATSFGDDTTHPTSTILPCGRISTTFDALYDKHGHLTDESVGVLIATNPEQWIREEIYENYNGKKELERKRDVYLKRVDKFNKQLKFINHALAQL